MKARHRIRNRFTKIMVPVGLLAVLAGEGRPQSQSSAIPISPLSREHNGWRLYNATTSFGYSSLALPTNSAVSAFSLERLEGDYDSTASVSLGYNYAGPKSALSLLYAPSYVRRVRYSQLSTFNHSLNLNGSLQLARRWDLSAAFAGTESTLDQLLFSPAILSVATTPLATLEDLIQTTNSGQYTSDQLASILTGSPYVATPARSIFYGTRYLSTSLNSKLSYRYSPRLSVTFTAGATYSKTRNDDHKNLQGQSNFLIPRTTTEQAGISVNYSLSPRTEIGVQANSTLVDSTLARYVVSNTGVFLSRKLSPKVFIRFSGGPGFMNVLKVDPLYSGQIINQAFTGDASIGYTVRSFSMIGSYGRAIGDGYGFGSQSSDILAGSWQWSPSRSITVYASGGLQRMFGGVLGDVQNWNSNAGIARSISRQLSVNCAYGYVSRKTHSSNLTDVVQQDLSGSSVRVTLVWTPRRQEAAGSAAVGR